MSTAGRVAIPSTFSHPLRLVVAMGFAYCLLAVSANSSRAQTLDDTGLWFAALGNGELELTEGGENPLRWWFDAHYRLRDDTDGFNQSIVRPGLGYEIADNQVLWAGYAWIRTSPAQAQAFDEHRFWQQWTAAPKCGDYRYLHRSRFEQRWFDTSDEVALRWRQLFRIQRVLCDSPEWSAIVWDEVFLNLNDTDSGIEAGFNQNRAFLGVGYRRSASAPVRTEIGYLNQIINAPGDEDLMNHILSINFFF